MNLSIETLNVLLLFFPGLLASAVLKGVLKRSDIDATQRLIEAILFTIVITVAVTALTDTPLFARAVTLADGELGVAPGTWGAFALTALLAVLVPLPIAAVLSRYWHMKGLRRLGVTSRTSRGSIWEEAFVEQGNRFVVLHLTDGRRLQGFPMYWSPDPADGFIFLDQPAWIVWREGIEEDEVVPTGQHGTLVHRSETRFIEFQPR